MSATSPRRTANLPRPLHPPGSSAPGVSKIPPHPAGFGGDRLSGAGSLKSLGIFAMKISGNDFDACRSSYPGHHCVQAGHVEALNLVGMQWQDPHFLDG
ncbi:hypothetical protein ARTHRO9AX_80042 [Arthrobacter sp. 9AX]|nr:hypothetical protein ARTHRO9AX_80042 [Arthrobacter sp. 9AX]